MQACSAACLLIAIGEGRDLFDTGHSLADSRLLAFECPRQRPRSQALPCDLPGTWQLALWLTFN